MESKNFLGLPDLAGWRQARQRSAVAGVQLDDLVQWASAHRRALVAEVFSAVPVEATVSGLIAMPTKSVHDALDGTDGGWRIASIPDLAAMESSRELLDRATGGVERWARTPDTSVSS